MNRREFFALVGAVLTAPFLPKIAERKPEPVIQTSGYLQVVPGSGDHPREIVDLGHQHTLYPAGQNIGISYQNIGINPWQNQ